MLLYSVTKRVASGDCSTGDQHAVIILTNCTVCVCAEFYVLVSVIVDKDDVCAESSVIQGWQFKGLKSFSIWKVAYLW